MSRWQPDAAERLRVTAMTLFAERGYEQTTVADIAAAAGLTARTFFRYFGDKREVLFAGSDDLLATMTTALVEAPADTAPLDAVAAALDAGAARLGGDRDYARRRSQLISTHADLREREVMKLASLSAALAGGLRDRGVAEPAASLAADAGVAVFRVAFDRWVAEPAARPLASVMVEAMAQLRAVTRA